MQVSVFRRVMAALAMAAIVLVAPAVTRAAQPIKIGLSMSLTGNLAGGGKSALLAMQMWVEDTNAKGGLLGRPIELTYYDDQSSSSNVPGIYTKLLEVDKVDLVISAYATNQIAPAMPIVMQRDLVFMSLFGTGVNDKFHYDKYFQILPNGKETRFGPSLGFLETAMTMQPKPKTIALVGADAEYAQTVLAGAREKLKDMGLQIVYDRSYPPTTVDFIPIVRSIQATNPDVVYVASYPSDTVGMVRAAHETGLRTKMFGGGMIGLGFAPIKQQLGPLLNGIVAYEVYAPEPSMQFPGVQDFLKRYQAKAPAAGVDTLGFYLPPFAYAAMQILGQAVEETKALDQAKIAAYIHKTAFKTVVGDISFAENGEWAEPRIIFVQYRGITGNDLEQFKKPGTAVVLAPARYKSGDIVAPYSDIKR
jgi:branched-chain amino acid transport system substrate-binding protein